MWRYQWRVSLGAIAIVMRRREHSHLALAHLGYAVLPGTYDLARAQGEEERLAAVAGRVELGTVLQFASEMYKYCLAPLWETLAIS